MRSSQAARGLGSDALAPPFLPGLSFSVAAFLAASEAASFDAADAARATLPAADAAGRAADAAAKAGKTAADVAPSLAKAGADADNCGVALLAGVMAAVASGATPEPESSLKAMTTTPSTTALAISHMVFFGDAAGAATAVG